MDRSPAGRHSWAVLGVVLIALSMSGGARAHRLRFSREASPPGEFSYYLLSLSWSPSFCARSPSSAECRGPKTYGFIVHGLWPQRERGRLEYCRARGRVPAQVARGLVDLMPVRALVFHEWKAHGSCSGLEPEAYFGLLRRAARSVAIPPGFVHPRLARRASPRRVVEEFIRANPALPAQAAFATCSRGRDPQLSEVRVCMDRSLAPRACSASALAGRCRAPLIDIPPVG